MNQSESTSAGIVLQLEKTTNNNSGCESGKQDKCDDIESETCSNSSSSSSSSSCESELIVLSSGRIKQSQSNQSISSSISTPSLSSLKPSSLLPSQKGLATKLNINTPPDTPTHSFHDISKAISDGTTEEDLPKLRLEKEQKTTTLLTTTTTTTTTTTMTTQVITTTTTTTTSSSAAGASLSLNNNNNNNNSMIEAIPEQTSSPIRSLSSSCGDIRSPKSSHNNVLHHHQQQDIGGELGDDDTIEVDGATGVAMIGDDGESTSSLSTSSLSTSSSLTSTSSNHSNNILASSSPLHYTKHHHHHHHHQHNHGGSVLQQSTSSAENRTPNKKLNESIGSNWSNDSLTINTNSAGGGSSGNSINGSLTPTSTSLTPNRDVRSVLLRVKLPESHPLITKVARFPLNFTVKETLDRIHELVVLENRVNLIILFNRMILSHNQTLSNYFGADEGIVQTIELKEITSMSSNTTPAQLISNLSSGGNGAGGVPKEKPKLLHASSVQNLLASMPTKKRHSSDKEKLLFQPPLPSYTKELDKLFWISNGVTGSGSKSIPCLFHKWKCRDSKVQSDLTILYSGGDREDLGLIRKNMRILSDILQCNIFCYDYTGFGLNASGKPTLKELCNDISIVFNYLTNTLNISPSSIILMGKSIGTICSIKFASSLYQKSKSTLSLTSPIHNNNTTSSSTPTSPISPSSPYSTVASSTTPISESKQSSRNGQPLGGLVVIASFGPSTLGGNIVNMLLSIESFDHLKKVERIACPTLVVHGDSDDIVNIKSAKKLSKLFPNLFRYVPVKEATHWNIDTKYLDDYADDMIDFVKHIAPEQYTQRQVELPSSYAMSPSKVVGAWLERLQLQEYTNNFLQAGYFEMMSIASLDKSMLEFLGVGEQHIPTLLGEIEKLVRTIFPSSAAAQQQTMVITAPIGANNIDIDLSCSIDLTSTFKLHSTVTKASRSRSSSNSNTTINSNITNSSSTTIINNNNTNNINNNNNSKYHNNNNCECEFECICSKASIESSNTTNSINTKTSTFV
ncbi:hypothetical protein DFA_12045 [Cavenderia fasciculata]|uniref:SAM domain-containing protein n=1 Tax=Cavenderia fasciculata TaxID=261658 RepID=F4QFH4_CACFS|nr:uncharacterized protein DFA_12045 [Cavenderia fasciculata]EGG14275.1 hypothetical protein DFA_12045 [Cavenderia fasciculata]|eukprot:XP_004350984.1 hypothetical protein DFA_12045 [Cavenderia fasciculata]